MTCSTDWKLYIKLETNKVFHSLILQPSTHLDNDCSWWQNVPKMKCVPSCYEHKVMCDF